MEKKQTKLQKLKYIFFALVLIVVFSSSEVLYAATLSTSPASATYATGSTFSASVYVASTDKAMNAAAALVTFPKDLLQVVSVSKAGSIIDFWAQEPSFSNTSGTVKFEGAVLTPGYTGPAGKLLTINFRAKTPGTAKLALSETKVYANDGAGTSILQSSSGATYTITEAAREVPAEIKLNEEKPVEPNAPAEAACDNDSLIYSTTHPGTIWRKNNTAVFSWDVGPDVVASRIGFDQNPSGEPSVLNSPAIVEKKYDNVADGVWYFHLSLQNNDGWTKTEHFKIKVDQTAPKITLSEVPRTDLTNPKPVINLKVTDAMSCVKEFTLSIDGQPIDYNKRLDGALELGTVDPGQHELSVVAYDRAGNQNEAFLDIKVSALDTPVVKEYPNEVSNAGEISVKGETIQNANLTAKITTKGNNFVAREDFQSGSGTFTWKPSTKLPRGIVYVSFKVSDSRGASSNFSEPIAIKIGHGVHVNISDLVAKIPPGVAMAGLVIVGIFLVVIITRALTIRRFKREHSDWD
jgi:hypothetical protein